MTRLPRRRHGSSYVLGGRVIARKAWTLRGARSNARAAGEVLNAYAMAHWRAGDAAGAKEMFDAAQSRLSW